MVLKDLTSIKKPTNQFTLEKNNNDLEIRMIDYYRCLDTISKTADDDDNDDKDKDKDGDGSDDDDDDDEEEAEEETNQYSKEKQKELSHTKPLLIKGYGILESGHSITINFQGYLPFFYIKIPDNWERKQCNLLTEYLRKAVYYKYSKHLVKTQIVIRKPFSEFTGNDKFKYLKLYFKNKESYDTYAYKFAKPFKVDGLTKDDHKYDLFESNIEPIIKFIHLTGIDPSGWVKIPKHQYEIRKDRTSHTNFEIVMNWDKIQPSNRIDNATLNTVAFDIEADSSHGDFPIGIKDYQKLAQDLITFYNEYGVNTHKKKKHRILRGPMATKKVIKTALSLVFNDNYNNNGINQILTVDNLKPHPETVQQLSYTIMQLFDLCNDQTITNDELIEQVTDIFEYNLPPIDLQSEDSSHYSLLAHEIIMQLFLFNRNKNKQFREAPHGVISMMINLAFNDYFDAFKINCVYTKRNVKPEQSVIDAIVPDICRIIENCAQFVHFKKMPEPPTITTSDGMVYDKENMTQDAFVKSLNDLLNKHLPDVEGDKLIQIGSTFQLTGQSDCYLKHIICLGSCNGITNEELIKNENAGIYLPAEDLAIDLITYEKQFGLYPETDSKDSNVVDSKDKALAKKQFDDLVEEKMKEIKSWDLPYRQQQCQKAAEYRRIKQSQTDNSKVVVEFFNDEKSVLLAWKELILINDPDVVVGYNIFGFDFKFLYERALEQGCAEEFCQLGRIKGNIETLHEQKLCSAGLGDNVLRYIPMNGRVLIDLYKVIQKDYNLSSYKLDSVCHKFLYKEKVDISPKEIFILQKGSAEDRKNIAVYCLIDCILCNRLVSKLEIIGNNIAMSNVCKVPFPYLFLRGQGVKIFSLVADFCSKEGFLIPVLPKADLLSDETFEGAIVLTPFTGIYFDPIAVADFNSLYPSSMISENLSHDSFTIIGGKYDNLPGFEYVNIEYDIYKWTTLPGRKKKVKVKIGTETCRYAQLPNGKKSILPSILMKMLSARKDTREKMKTEQDPFKVNILNGLQLAYKVTANSLYGQCGAKTSPINKTPIAASTTAIGRNMIMFSKGHVETNYKDIVVTIDTGVDKKGQPVINKYTGMVVHVKDSYCVYGDTDSIFIKFNCFTPEGVKIKGIDAVFISMELCRRAAKEISVQLKKPQNLEVEKVIYPFILISKKRYHGHYYTKMCDEEFYANSMGIALKRRDNAPIVKHIYGGCLDIIMKDHDINKSLEFVKTESIKLLKGGFPLEEFTISKTLRSYYKKPNQIAHNVLANRQAQRDPGNRFEPNDRVPYAFIIHPNPSKSHLQGDIIETPQYIRQNKLALNYKMYLTNQIMVPVAQIFDLVPGFKDTTEIFNNLISTYENDRLGAVKLDHFIKKKTGISLPNLKELIDKAKASQEALRNQVVEEDNDYHHPAQTNDDDDHDHDDHDDGVCTSNYEDPNF